MPAHWNIIAVTVTTFIGCVYAPGACNAPSLHVWPLGPTVQGLDLVTMSRGTMGSDLAIGSFQPDVGYNSTRFTGPPNSYVSVRIDAYTPIDDLDDYAIQFYVKFDSVIRGTIFSFESDAQSQSAITKFRLEILNGALLLNITDYGQKVINTDMVTDTWYHVVFMRDKNHEYFKYHLDHQGSSIEVTISNAIFDLPTLFPATVLVGQDTDSQNPLLGEVACLQFVPCRDPYSSTYDSNCVPVAWPIITSTTTTTTTTTTPQTTRIDSTATGTNTAAGHSTTAVSGTTTEAGPSTTAATATTTATGNIDNPPVTHRATLQAQDFSVGDVDVCKRYTLLANDREFASAADILRIVPGTSSVECARQCNIHTPCDAYSFNGMLCTLGLNGPTVIGQGTKFYTLS